MGKEIFFGTLPRGQEMIQVVGVIVLKFGFVQPIYFEQKMVVAIPPLQTKYVAYIKRMGGKMEALSAFEISFYHISKFSIKIKIFYWMFHLRE